MLPLVSVSLLLVTRSVWTYSSGFLSLVTIIVCKKFCINLWMFILFFFIGMGIVSILFHFPIFHVHAFRYGNIPNILQQYNQQHLWVYWRCGIKVLSGISSLRVFLIFIKGDGSLRYWTFSRILCYLRFGWVLYNEHWNTIFWFLLEHVGLFHAF